MNKTMSDRIGVTLEDVEGLTCYEYVHGTSEPPEYCPHSKLLIDAKEHEVEVCKKKVGR